jgi:hypothetical protein
VRWHGSHRLERHHLVGRHSLVQFARPGRRHRRRGRGQGRVFVNRLVGPQSKTIYAIVLSPLTGFILALLMVHARELAFCARQPGHRRRLCSASSSLSHGGALSRLGHGSNDAQKTAGIIAVLLYSHGVYSEFTVPGWVILSCYSVMGLGTLLGGWRIVHTMGSKITRLTPMQGVLRRDGRCPHAVRRNLSRHPGVDDTYDHQRHHRRGIGKAGFCRAVERGNRHCLCVDHHHARCGHPGGHLLLAGDAYPEMTDQHLQQVAALCWRKRKDGVEVMLVTSRETRRWVIPKGWPMEGLTDYNAARREALEEAGVEGHMKREPVGQFFYEKRGKKEVLRSLSRSMRWKLKRSASHGRR